LGNPEIDWLEYVNENRRADVLETLQVLSSLLDRDRPQFVLIGALSLLLRRALFRRSLWDVDLLFRDEDSLRELMVKARETGARIVHYDDELVVKTEISSMHTAWRFQNAWVNVDYILRDPYFEFYSKGLTLKEPFSERVSHQGNEYEVVLFVAHPWDVLIDKMLSPRFENELESKNFMGVDVRHVFLLLRLHGEMADFWEYVMRRVEGAGATARFATSLRKVLRAAKGIAEDGIGGTLRAERALGVLEGRGPEEGSHA
jgi:hypothetical protein